ncbi:translation initiation factor IF-2, N-terminal domain protein [Anaerococcus hydrogenalis DSM 7454]|uniref:Translation initiation factor IF-2, N-terminal domain protein n=1 Tax=Anaerococcus hydrogenalis DSM 7454 TaxID=561177 RepID=B6W936_9FIRM|nr:translation initiation factor IF-2 N-terminal domain-containing protein [Anaerococcus hydrogenalis]EEB36092.1 translation initiation factor IF-2, N-terminal domain protein [Anaerococcus hydrogenalis DSM 7454]
MANKLRIYELAKNYNKTTKEMLKLLKEEFGLEIKSHMSVLGGDDLAIVEEYFSDNKNEDKNKNQQKEKKDDKKIENKDKKEEKFQKINLQKIKKIRSHQTKKIRKKIKTK